MQSSDIITEAAAIPAESLIESTPKKAVKEGLSGKKAKSDPKKVTSQFSKKVEAGIAKKSSDKPLGKLSGKKAHRYRPGTVALREIRRYQKSFEDLIPLAPFVRVVREIGSEFKDVRWKHDALAALRTACEKHLVDVFRNAYTLTMHRKCVTITEKDMAVAVNIIKNAGV